MKNVEIIIGGDIVPTDSNIKFFENGRISEIIDKEILNILTNADIRIFNLETPICDKKTPIEKEGPCFHTSTKSVHGLKALKPSILTLANNHIMDQGIKGLESTIAALESESIAYVGVGKNYTDSNKAWYTKINGKRIGVYGCVEHEYSYATDNFPGATPFEALDIADTIRKIKKKCNYLIVLYHGGKEYYEYPSPDLQKRCRKMVNAGADCVICQHSHCIGTFENYNKGFILYGQGNFLLDRYAKVYEKYFQTGLLVKINITNEQVEYSLIPIIKQGNGVRIAEKNEKIEIINEVLKRQEEISRNGFVDQHFKEYVKTIAYRLIFRQSRLGFIISSIDIKFFNGIILNRDLKHRLGKHHRLAVQNCIQCEVHNEVLKTYLDNRSSR